MSPLTKTSTYQKLSAGFPTTNNSRISTHLLETPTLTEKTSTIALSPKFGVTSIIIRSISMGQMLLNQIKRILRTKTKKMTKVKRRITRTLVNQEVIQPKSINYYYLQKPRSPPPYRRFPVDQEPLLNKQVRFLESPETHHQSQVRFLYPLYPKESNPCLHLDPAPWYHLPPQYQQHPTPQRPHQHRYRKKTP